MSLKIRRGLAASRTTITPAEGEFIYTTDTKIVYIGDGTTAGGNILSGGGSNTAGYLQVANATTLFNNRLTVANSRNYLQVANSKTYLQVANSKTYLQVANATTLFNNRLTVANSRNYLQVANSKTYLQVANSKAYLQVSNATILFNNRLTVANSRNYLQVANSKTYLQVANAATLYATKVNPTTSGLLAHTGRATISTNLNVSGNTVVSGLVANGTLGTSNYVLKTNGTTVFWGVDGGDVSLSADISGSSQSFTGNGSTVAFTLSASIASPDAIVTINGLVQKPTTHYSISSTTLTFTTAPSNGSSIEVRKFSASAFSGSASSFSEMIVANFLFGL